MLQPSGTPAPSDAVIGLTDDVERRVARELESEYQRGVGNELLVGAIAIPAFIFGEVTRELSGQQDLPLLAIFGVRLAFGVFLLAAALTIRHYRNAVRLARFFDITAMLLVGLLVGALDAYTLGENPLYFGSIGTIPFLRCLYVPSGWRVSAIACGLCWLGSLSGSLGGTILWSGFSDDPIFWAKFGNQQFFVMTNATLAVMGGWLVNRLRTREIQARSRGRYKLLKPIGSGGFGEVWGAWDNLLERSCAIKMLDPRYGAQEEYIGRFELEAKATCRLSSPHTVRVYDYGCTREQRLYYVMEHLRGRDLSSILEEGRLTPQRAVPLLRQAASALAEAHDAGVVHRDIKPENLFITVDESGEEVLKVLDFGLAAALTDQVEDGQKKERLIGTPEYMSPERARGQRGDARSDVYALGAVMFHLLTGQVPFDGETSMSVLVRHVQEPARRPSSLDAGVPEFLDSIVLKCLEKNPDERFQDMRSVRKALMTAEVILLRERPRRVA